MDNKKPYKVQYKRQILLTDTMYYIGIYKKTEKIVESVFYIKSKTTHTSPEGQDLFHDISRLAKRSLESVLATLTLEPRHAYNMQIAFLNSLVSLQSMLKVSQHTGAIKADLLDVLTYEIDTVIRNLSLYLESTSDDSGIIFDESEYGISMQNEWKAKPAYAQPETHKTSPLSQHQKRSGVHNATQERNTMRQETILDIIRSQGEVSIKDISAVIKDISEKTLQREINEMIKKSLVVRHGKKRWSKYALA